MTRMLAIVALAACNHSAPAPGEPEPEPVPRCTVDLADQLAKLDVPGASAGIVKNGALQCTTSAGMADVQAGREVTPDTLFFLASTSKTVTAVAVLQLADSQQIALDDDVTSYLPYHVAIPKCTGKPITFRQLLTHTGSIADNPHLINCPIDCPYGAPLLSNVTRGADSPIPMAQFTEQYLTPGTTYYNASLNFEDGCPGTIDDYSNMGITFAAATAEAITGTPFDQLTRDRIFDPLGMTETSWKLADIDPTHLAIPYDRSTAGWVPYGSYGEIDYPDGDLRSSVRELSRFLEAIIGGGGGVLAPDTVAELERPQIPDLDPTQGLVWYYDDLGPSSRNVLGHEGADNGVSTKMFFDPKTSAGVILLSNGVWDDDAARALMDALFEEAASY